VNLPLSAVFVYWESLVRLAATKIEAWQQGAKVGLFLILIRIFLLKL
jgi:hypothetical protein